MEIYDKTKHILTFEASKYISRRANQMLPEERVYYVVPTTALPYAGRVKKFKKGWNEVTAKKVWMPSIGLAVEVFDRQRFYALFAEYPNGI
jgi:hypothetical protein